MHRRTFIKANLLTGAALAVASPVWSGVEALNEPQPPLPHGKPLPKTRTPPVSLLEHKMIARHHTLRKGRSAGLPDPSYYKTRLVHPGTAPLGMNT